MLTIRKGSIVRTILTSTVLAAATSGAFALTTIPTNFNGYGTTTNGYQDGFNSTTFNAGWEEILGSTGGTGTATVITAGTSGHFTLPGDGTLHLNADTTNSDPNKLLYTGTYSGAETVLALIEANNLPTANDDTYRGGVSTSAGATTGQGYDALLTDHNGGAAHLNNLNDQAQWGSGGATYTSTTNPPTYYWLRLTDDGNQNITSKLWLADGTTAEPSAGTSDSNLGNVARSGIAGLVTNSVNGNGSFQVGYVLIQNAALPSITEGLVPEPATFATLAGGVAVLLGLRRRRA